MSQDLEELVLHLKDVWKVQEFHLLGHSLGGAIGFEFLKRQIIQHNVDENRIRDTPQCLSFILSNASTNFQLSSSEQMRLFQEFQLQHLQTRMPPTQTQRTKTLNGNDQFFQTHICRTSTKPAELVSALSRRGKEWSAKEYTALALARDSIEAADATYTSADTTDSVRHQFPPALIIRGQYDFITDACTRGWKDLITTMEDVRSDLEEVVMKDCAHYPHFEQPDNYSSEVEAFCSMSESP